MTQKLRYPPDAMPSERGAFRRAVNDLARGWDDTERERLVTTAARHVRQLEAFGDLLAVYRGTEPGDTPPADAVERTVKQALAAGLLAPRTEEPQPRPQPQPNAPPRGSIGEAAFVLLTPHNAGLVRQLAGENNLDESQVINLALDALAGALRLNMSAIGHPLDTRAAVAYMQQLADARPLMLFGRGFPPLHGKDNGEAQE